jgi:two-component system, chemotaxis family, chemotaxis protein CheY
MKTILVVEDIAYARHFICNTLQNHGYNTMGASSAQEAYDVLSDDSATINLVLSDFNIPDSTGFDLLRTIKNNPTLEDMPVVFLTNDYHSDKIQFARKSGMASFIQKPLREDNLFTEIDRAMGIKGAFRSLSM